MKLRQGFVSNSSSSSFIMVGVLVELTEDQIEELEATELDVEYETDVPGNTNDMVLVGNMIASSIEEEYGGVIDIQSEMIKATMLLNRYGVDGVIQLFYGNRQC
jgi:hypothetical protein